MSILEVDHVSIRYMTGDFKEIGLKEYTMRRLKGNYHVQEFWADKDVTFSLEKGDMLGIIGVNGAGKSTLLKAISGIMEPSKGYVKREGNIAALLELASGFDGELTVRENTYLRGAMLGYTRSFMDEKYEEIIDFAELQEFQDRPFRQLSSGMKSRLAFSIASLVQPDLLILDEVLSVGDGAFQQKSAEKMREIIQGGATTILVSHSIDQIRQLCSKVLWLHKGEQIAFSDDVEGICNQYQDFLEGRAGLPINKAAEAQEEREDGTKPPQINKMADKLYDWMKSIQFAAMGSILLLLIGGRLAYGKSPLFFVWSVVALLFCSWCFHKRQVFAGQIQSLFSRNARDNLFLSLGCTVCFSMIAHGFLFSNEFFSHDSIQFMYYKMSSLEFYAGIGRFIIPIYEVLKGDVSAPWLIGVLFIAWMTLTSFLVIEFLQIKGKTAIALVSGLLCTNTAFILTGATYIYCLDEYALALLTAAAAAYFLCRVPKGKALAIFFLILSLSIYQSYFTVTAALCFIAAFQRLLENEKTKKIISDGLGQIGAMLISFIAYFLVWTLICWKLGIVKQRTDEMLLLKNLNGFGEMLTRIYRDYFKMLLNTDGILGDIYVATNALILLFILKMAIDYLRRKDFSFSNKLLMVTMLFCTPIAFSIIKIVLPGYTSELTCYASESIFIFFIVWCNWQANSKEGTHKEIQMAAMLLVCCIIYNNLVLANEIYMKKNMEKTATISLVTRMIDRVETLEGYAPQVTPVYVVGSLQNSPLNQTRPDSAYLGAKAGLWSYYSATYNLSYYITGYLNYPMLISEAQDLAALEDVQNMPTFPAQGSVKMIDGAAVIKVS